MSGMYRGLGVCAVALLLVGLAAQAQAAPITYGFTSGTATVTVTAGVTELTPLGGAPLAMNGIFVTFDDMVPSVDDFEQTITPGETIGLSPPYGGFDEIEIVSASLAPGVGYVGGPGITIVPGSLFQVTLTNVEVTGIYTGSLGAGPESAPIPISFTNPNLTATISLTGIGELTMSEVTLGVLDGALFGETEDLVIKADILWQGIQVLAPEPAPAALVLVAVAGLVIFRRLLRA